MKLKLTVEDKTNHFQGKNKEQILIEAKESDCEDFKTIDVEILEE